MSGSTEFVIGTKVVCSDGECGELQRVVINPVARSLTHLVVGPEHGRATGRLVPVDLVESSAGEIHLRCRKDEFAVLEEAEETTLLPGASGEWAYAQGAMMTLPYYQLGMGGMAMGMGGTAMAGVGTSMRSGPPVVTYDKVPLGDVEVRRGAHVTATDGTIGRVQGLVIDPADHHVTHFLLEEGHLWGKKEVAIPISAVTGVDDGVKLSLSKDQVRDLPGVEIDHGS
jgi:sporulation protein YlmC with PRC-barrel domain